MQSGREPYHWWRGQVSPSNTKVASAEKLCGEDLLASRTSSSPSSVSDVQEASTDARKRRRKLLIHLAVGWQVPAWICTSDVAKNISLAYNQPPPAPCPPVLNRDSIKHCSTRVIKQSSWLATEITLTFHAAFLLENPKPQELHFHAGLNNTVGIGKAHVVAVWCIDVAQCDGQKISDFPIGQTVLLRWL